MRRLLLAREGLFVPSLGVFLVLLPGGLSSAHNTTTHKQREKEREGRGGRRGNYLIN